MVDFLVSNLVPLLEIVLVFLVGALLMLVRRAPAMLQRMARSFQAEAKKTKGTTDDVAAALLVAFADALAAAVTKELGKK